MLLTKTLNRKSANRKSHHFSDDGDARSQKVTAFHNCLPKLPDYFFFVESTLAFRLSFAAVAAESIVVLAESAAAVTLSLATVAAESTLVSVLEEPLQAANAPTANTTKSFFIVICLIVNDFKLIPRLGKSNLRFLSIL
jgi:hypothetical protein